MHLGSDFTRQLTAGQAQVQLIVSGTDSTRTAPVINYFNTAVRVWAQKRTDRAGTPVSGPQVQVIERIWFNDANTSTWFMVPGLIVLIMTLVGTFLTALVMAREWERGTLEALFVTP